jgi:hypothetical protein
LLLETPADQVRQLSPGTLIDWLGTGGDHPPLANNTSAAIVSSTPAPRNSHESEILLLNFQNVRFDYEPYPLGLISGVFDDDFYSRLVTSYPALQLFKHMPMLGEKYSLSASNNPGNYYRFLKDNPDWHMFHEYVLSESFVASTLAMFDVHNLDLGLPPRHKVRSRRPRSISTRLNRMRNIAELSARFEFSMMNGRGGHILPHTDSATKIITFVFSIVAPNEWDQKWGGGTAVVWPKEQKHIYNQTNKQLKLDQVDSIREYPFESNQALVFIKTFNSWHAVLPMRATEGSVLRKTLTVNIERRA